MLEYRVRHVDYNARPDPEKVEKLCNDMAADGWSLSRAVGGSGVDLAGRVLLIFERPKK